MKQRPLLLMTSIMAGIFLASIDALVVGTAMPTVIRELGGLRLYSWVFNAYILATALTIPLFGKLSDVYPKQYIYSLSVGIFLLGSALCGLSQSIIQLVLFRGIQGLGAGGMFSVPFAIIGTVFEPKKRGRMIGYTSTVWGVSSIIGPALGSLIVTQFSWRWVFYVNVPVGIIAVVMLLFTYRESGKRKRMVMDYSGLLVLGTAITLFLLAFLNMSQETGISAFDIFFLTVGTGAFYLFYIIEKKSGDPVIPVKMLHESHYIYSNACAFLSGAVILAAIAFIPFLVQTIKQGSAIQAGGVLMPISFAWSGTSIILGHFLGHVHPRYPAAAGFIFIAAGLTGFLFARPDMSYWIFIVSGMVLGAGAGMVTPTLLVAVQSFTQYDEIGSVTSTLQLFNRIGGVIGIGITGAVFSMLLYHYISIIPSFSQLMENNADLLTNPHRLFNPESPEAGAMVNSDEMLSLFSRAFKGAFSINIFFALIGFILALYIPKLKKQGGDSLISKEQAV